MTKTLISILAIFWLFTGCSDDDTIVPLDLDFEITLSSNVAPSELTITNNSTGATSFHWMFIGANPENSTEKAPSKISYSEAGEYTIILEASNGLETKSIARTFTLETDEIVAYENIHLGGIKLQSTVGCLFSTSSGRVIKSTELSKKMVPLSILLSLELPVYAFLSLLTRLFFGD